jgi:predicted transcriptional regulator
VFFCVRSTVLFHHLTECKLRLRDVDVMLFHLILNNGDVDVILFPPILHNGDVDVIPLFSIG